MQNGLVMRHAQTLCMEDVICWIDSLEDLFLEYGSRQVWSNDTGVCRA
jgi:hypothetical protein